MSFQRKFSYLSDPPVSDTPYVLDVDEDRCIGCGLCVRQCPCQTVALVERDFSPRQEPTCQASCPAGVDIRSCMRLLAEGGAVEEAWRIIVDANPFPSVTGRVCPHPCESRCNRISLDQPVNIRTLERFVGDYAIDRRIGFDRPVARQDRKVGIVGSGPSGLSCAYQLARRGYSVTVFERNPQPGGMLRYAIPEHRLPRQVVEREIERLAEMQIAMQCNTALGTDITFESLKEQFDAVYVATGAQKGTELGIEGEGAPNVYSGLDLLKQLREGSRPQLGKRVVVIGGGNTAIDAARVARRMGCEVTVAYRRSAQEMPAMVAEVGESVEEGVDMRFLCVPVRIDHDAGGRASKITLVETRLGEPDGSGRRRPVPIEGSEFTLDVDAVISAVGQRTDPAGMEHLFDSVGWITADRFCRTKDPAIFSGGDVVSGPSMVCDAIGAGRRAAQAIVAYLGGNDIPATEKRIISYEGMPLTGCTKAERNESAKLQVEERLSDPDREVVLPLVREGALDEATRCLICGRFKPVFASVNDYFPEICIACHNCEAVCPHDALRLPRFYQVQTGRWTTAHRCPAPGRGFPNPFGHEHPSSFEEIAPGLTEVERVIYTRRSNRIFTSEQVPRALVQRVLEAGRFAPSAGNNMPWQFLVIRERAFLDEIARDCRAFLTKITNLYQGRDRIRKPIKDAMALLMPNAVDQRPMVAIQAMLTPKFGQGTLDMFHGAKTVIFILSNRLGISSPALDAGICGQNMVLTAHALGLGTCYVGFAAEPVNKLPALKKKLGLEWPFDHVATTIALGYPAVRVDRAVDREFPPVRWIEPG